MNGLERLGTRLSSMTFRKVSLKENVTMRLPSPHQIKSLPYGRTRITRPMPQFLLL